MKNNRKVKKHVLETLEEFKEWQIKNQEQEIGGMRIAIEALENEILKLRDDNKKLKQQIKDMKWDLGYE